MGSILRKLNGSLRRPRLTAWDAVGMVCFAVVTAEFVLEAVLDQRSIGSHALLYTDAARAWVSGADPWAVGGYLKYAGPPPMLLPYLPFTMVPADVTRAVWVLGSLLLALALLRRLHLPGWWIAFPPIAQVIQLGHPEIVVLGVLVFGGPLAGLGPLVKPYAGAALLAERRWRAIAIGLIVLVASAPFLPWAFFAREFSTITATVARQSVGDSVFGQPALMVVAVVAVVTLGWRRGLWLAMPVLWPAAQPYYKVLALPAISPILAIFWALPIPGFTLLGLVFVAIADLYVSTYGGPHWLASGIDAPGLHALALGADAEGAEGSVRP